MSEIKSIWVKEHYRNGRRVRGHWRNIKKGSHKEDLEMRIETIKERANTD